jgi:hypothetical protein
MFTTNVIVAGYLIANAAALVALCLAGLWMSRKA